MNKSFPYNCRERGVRERAYKWLYNKDTTTQRHRILGNVKAFLVGCLVGAVIQLIL